MNCRCKVVLLTFAMALSVFLPLSSVSAAAVPNANHIYALTIGTPETVDPHWAYDTASAELIQNVYEPLCMFDGVETGKFVGGVADSWPGFGSPGNVMAPSAPDPTAPAGTAQTWYFRIRVSMPWQDPAYGVVTPADVEYSFERGMFFDHTNGPMWMLYEPLLGGASSYDYDYDASGVIDNNIEFQDLYANVTGAIGSNATHVWFNLVGGYAPFQQILSQTWAMVMCKAWSIANGLWNPAAADLYAEFIRQWDPPSPGPLMNPAKAMGSGPYKLDAMDEDPNSGFWRLARFINYWGGWPAPGASGFADFVTSKAVNEWANRKAQFLSTDPNLQADFTNVPRANTPEIHQGGDIYGPVLPGFTYYQPPFPSQALDAIYYTYTIAAESPFIPLVGATPKADLMTDRHFRLAMSYVFNFTTYINDVFLGEAVQSPMCFPPGTLYYNASKPKYGINLTRAQAELDLAWGGIVKLNGITMQFTFNIGNTARETACRILADGLNRLTWGGPVNIAAVGVPFATYLPALRAKQLPLFFIGWLADYPDPHNWVYPFMQSHGTYASRQNVVYGLDTPSLNWEDNMWGPCPYVNSLGENVPEINGTYIDHLIDVGVKTPNGPARQAIYEEIMDIYHAEDSQVPTVSATVRHYERKWINGWIGTFNENPIAPGRYYYTMWKALASPPQSVEVAAYDASMSPTNNITEYLVNSTVWSPQAGKPWMKLNYTAASTNPEPSMTAMVRRTDAISGSVLVLVTWNGITAAGHNEEFGFETQLMDPGDDLPFGPVLVSETAPEVGLYVNVTLNPYVLSDNSVNVVVGGAQNYYAGYFYMVGFCDINKDNVVTGKDLVLVKKAFQSFPGGAEWNFMADVNNNDAVTTADYELVKAEIPIVYTPA